LENPKLQVLIAKELIGCQQPVTVVTWTCTESHKRMPLICSNSEWLSYEYKLSAVTEVKLMFSHPDASWANPALESSNGPYLLAVAQHT